MAHVNIDKTENTAEKMEENDFIGFLNDEVKEHKNVVSNKVAILKKKQDGIDQSVQADPCSSSNNVDPRVQADPRSSSNNVDTRIYIYDEYDGPDQFVDFFEAIEMGNEHIREYFDLYEDIIFDTDPSIFEELCDSKKY